jgi:hypothetical protein
MKLKSIVFALFMALATFTTQAQIGDYRNDMCLGVSVGASMNKMGFDPIITQKFHTAPTVGLTFRYTSEKFLSAYCALQVELNYTRLGWTEDVLDSNSNPLPDTFKSNLDYLQLPFLARLAWGKEDKGTQFFFLVGPQIGYCIADKYTVSPQATVQLDAHQHPKLDNPFDWGAAAGLGCYYKVNKVGIFQIEARFNFSLGGVFDVGQLEYFKMANPMGLAVNLGYLWDFKVK